MESSLECYKYDDEFELNLFLWNSISHLSHFLIIFRSPYLQSDRDIIEGFHFTLISTILTYINGT